MISSVLWANSAALSCSCFCIHCTDDTERQHAFARKGPCDVSKGLQQSFFRVPDARGKDLEIAGKIAVALGLLFQGFAQMLAVVICPDISSRIRCRGYGQDTRRCTAQQSFVTLLQSTPTHAAQDRVVAVFIDPLPSPFLLRHVKLLRQARYLSLQLFHLDAVHPQSSQKSQFWRRHITQAPPLPAACCTGASVGADLNVHRLAVARGQECRKVWAPPFLGSVRR